MSVQNLPENVLLVTLHPEPRISDELKSVNELAIEQNGYDVIIDFSRVQIITSASIANLVILNQSLRTRKHRLILFGVSFLTKCTFRVAGLNETFDFAGDKSSALAALRTVN